MIQAPAHRKYENRRLLQEQMLIWEDCPLNKRDKC